MLIIFSASVSNGAPFCSELFASRPGGSLVEIEIPTPVKNQCSFQTCHFHALASSIESRYFQRAGTRLTLSTRYLSARLLFEESLKRVIEILEKSGEGKTLSEQYMLPTLALTLEGSLNAVLRMGLVPDKAWQPRRSLNTVKETDALQDQIQNVLVNFQRLLSKSDRSVQSLSQLQKEADRQIREVFMEFVGPWPEEFIWNQHTYTPKNFLYEMPFLTDLQTVRLTPEYIFGKKSSETTILEQERFLKRLIDDGQSITMNAYLMSRFIDTKTGVMTTARTVKNLVAPHGSHVMYVVGYITDQKSHKVLYWKIKNSWGGRSGDRGYYYMAEDYYRQYAEQLNFFTK